MTRKEAAEILEEVKLNDDSMYAYSEPYMTALDMAIGTLKARETSLEKVAADYGLMPDGVAFALEQYQKVLCDITHDRLSKPTYYAADIIRLVHDVQCDGRELIEPRVMTLEEVKSAWRNRDIAFLVEYNDGGNPVWMLYYGYLSTQEEIVLIDEIAHFRRFGVDGYGVDWRCWTSRPDEKRRVETPWN